MRQWELRRSGFTVFEGFDGTLHSHTADTDYAAGTVVVELAKTIDGYVHADVGRRDLKRTLGVGLYHQRERVGEQRVIIAVGRLRVGYEFLPK